MNTMLERSASFLAFLEEWQARWKPLNLAAEMNDPATVGVFSVDVISGFCYEGPLASQRVAAIVPPIVRLFRRAYQLGVRSFVLVQEGHSEGAKEFHEYGPHCTKGSSQAQTVKELAELPFADAFTIILKNSIHPALGTTFDAWVAAHPQISTCIVVGDCTDLCTYQLAMHLKLSANAADLPRRVIVPADCVETYDMPVDKARQLGILPHDADLLHLMFLYHMALNGIEIVSTVR